MFPTEFVAQRWRRWALRQRHLSVVWDESVLSWSRFRDTYCLAQAPGQRVDALIRKILCYALIEEARAERIFSRLLPATEGATAINWLSRVERIVPLLPQLVGALARREHGGDTEAERVLEEHDARRGGVAHDITALYTRYSAMLRRYRVYEPRWERVVPALPSKGARIFFPEVIADWELYAPLIARAPTIECYSPKGEVGAVRCCGYPSIHQEMEALASSVARLLAQGVDPADIVVSVAQLSTYHQLVAASMRSKAVPYTLRLPYTLSHYGPYQLLEGISQMVQFNFHYEVVQELWANPSIPWKEESGVATRLARAVARGAIYDALPAEMRRLCRLIYYARTASELLTHYNEFSERYLHHHDWRPPHDEALEKSTATMAALAHYEQVRALPVRRPFAILLSALQQSGWSRAVDGTVSVCDYPSAAGCEALHHFVVNTTDQAVRRERGEWEELPDQLRSTLQLDEQDCTPHTVALYRYSGAAVQFSFAERGWEGVTTPLPLLYELGAAPQQERAPPSGAEAGEAPEHPRTTEEMPEQSPQSKRGADYQMALWHSGATKQGGSTKVQSEGTAHRAAHLCDARDPTLVLIDFSRLRQFLRCPLELYVEKEMGIRPPESTINIDDPRRQGIIAHTTFAETLRRWRQRGRATLTVAEMPALRDILAEVAPETAAGSPAVVRTARRTTVQHQIAELLEVLCKHYSGWNLCAVEERYRRGWGNGRALLNGQVDVVLVDADNAQSAVIDLKRSHYSYTHQYPDRYLQLAFYAELVENEQRPLHSAAYLFTENPSKVLVIEHTAPEGKPSLATERHRLAGMLADYTTQVLEGNIALSNRALRCTRCRYPGVCRRGVYGG